METTIIIITIAALTIGALLGLWLRGGQVRTLRETVAAKEARIRTQGRELGELRAAEQRRQAQRVAAAKAAGESNTARAAARRAGQTGNVTAIAKPAKRARA